jgi:predicted DNA-binding transcriptional regulator AlpA
MDKSPSITPVRGPLLPQKKLAEHFGVSVSTLFRWRRDPGFPQPIRIRSRNYWSEVEANAFVTGKRDQPEPLRPMPKGARARLLEAVP